MYPKGIKDLSKVFHFCFLFSHEPYVPDGSNCSTFVRNTAYPVLQVANNLVLINKEFLKGLSLFNFNVFNTFSFKINYSNYYKTISIPEFYTLLLIGSNCVLWTKI